MLLPAIFLIAVLGCVSVTSALPTKKNDIFIGVKPSSAAGKAKLLYFVDRHFTWDDAHVYCRLAYNGDLVAIETPQDDEYIRDFMLSHNLRFAWTSGINEDGWRWGEGSVFTYTNWATGYPKSTSCALYVYAYNILTYHWKGASKSSSLGSICQA